jgi:hypothetical protein
MKDTFLNSALIVFAFGAILAAALDGARSAPQPPANPAESVVQTEPNLLAMRRAPAAEIPLASAMR